MVNIVPSVSMLLRR